MTESKKPIKALIVCKDSQDSKESGECHMLKHEGFEFLYSWKNTLTQNALKNVDIVIAIGGDGTILSASHYILDAPILAVNSSPETSVGALATLSLKELPKKLDQIKQGSYKTEKLERIEVSINDCPLDHLVLNEVFIGNEKAYLISKYVLELKNKKEKQLSSGIIVSTGTGSTAWFYSAGGKPFPKDSKFIKLIVREPYHSKLLKFSLINEEIKEGDEIKIIPSSPSTLAVDSIREYKLNPEDTVKIKISPHPLIRII
ncbi:MAG: NAD(+)/NADH kinase [Candidatus Nanoarchaeia archaeon]|nr:NAD(+)/NADH kinase [Candidatus Nanoarchaeia archaeon]